MLLVSVIAPFLFAIDHNELLRYQVNIIIRYNIRVLRGIEPTYIWGMSPTYYHNTIQYLTLKQLIYQIPLLASFANSFVDSIIHTALSNKQKL